MDRQADHKVRAVVIVPELGRRRPVGSHHLEDLRVGGPAGAPFSQILLFQELADTAVSIAATHGAPKTIEAGLVTAQLLAEGWQRVLRAMQ